MSADSGDLRMKLEGKMHVENGSSQDSRVLLQSARMAAPVMATRADPQNRHGLYRLQTRFCPLPCQYYYG